MSNKVFIIAEIGPNHNGDLNIAKSMVSDLSKIGVEPISTLTHESNRSLQSF